ncbi:MAG: response regulator [Sulfuritalea sp.]|nr:response regulator [Sulfuritalea sp.]
MNDDRPLILVVEDEPQIRRFVRAALEDEGRVVDAGSAAEALEAFTGPGPALAIIDLGLPDRDGVDLIRELRTWTMLPLLVLSARSAEAEKVAALDAGADDYLTKPFGVEEMRARVRALLRRQKVGAGETVIEFGSIRVDRAHRTVTRDGAAIHLTPIEYRLLGVLLTNAGRVLTHHQLLKDVWGPGHAERGHYLRIYVGHLRQKLEADPARPRYLLTETGVGYRFQLQDSST